MSPLVRLHEQVRAHAQNRPGVYRMLGPGGDLLYVGKSVRVRERLLSYFRAQPGDKAADILAAADALRWEYLPNEFAALLREFRLVRRLRPPFNVEHVDDAPICFVHLTDEPAPRLVRTDEAGAEGGLYYGPFHGRTRVEAALRELCDALGLRDCPPQTPLRFAARAGTPDEVGRAGCLRGEIHRCLAPCAARCTRAEYLERVEWARRFLEGQGAQALDTLREQMRAAVARLSFERAAQLRDRVARLEALRDELLALRHTGEALSFVYAVPGHAGADRLYLVRHGCVRAQVRPPRSERERAALARRAAEVFGTAPAAPRGGVSAREAGEMLLVARWFRRHPGERRRTVAAERFCAGLETPALPQGRSPVQPGRS